jgi:hypothetical protein
MRCVTLIKQTKNKRKLKTQPQLPRNQRLNLDPRRRRHLTHRQSIVGKYSLRKGCRSVEDRWAPQYLGSVCVVKYSSYDGKVRSGKSGVCDLNNV